jgi:hypothetical protein
MNALLNNTAFLVLTFFAVSAGAQQSSMELTCRAKAKEIAAQTYSSCVTEARNTQIDQIRKDYQKQLNDLKAKYDRELKKVGGKSLNTQPASAPKATPPVAANVSTGAAPKPTKGIAKTLPTRKEMKPAAPTTPEVKEDVVATPDSGTTVNESQPTQNDANGEMKMELVPAPASSDNNTASTIDQAY